ncbi:MAG: helix-turn-helix domain-containing protein [Opitutaceae bacterium]
MLESLKLGARYEGLLYLVESARNPPMLRPHCHVELELNLVVRGSISYVVGGRRFTFGQGALLWLFPAQEHQLVDRTPDAQAYVAVFKPSLIARSCRSPEYARLKRKTAEGDGVVHTVLPPDAFVLVRKIMDGLMEGAPDSEVLNREAGFGVGSGFHFGHRDPDRLNAGLHYLLLTCWRHQRAGSVPGGAVELHPAICKALERLTAAEDAPGLRELARLCGTSEAHFSRLFARQVGVPLARYRNSLRLERFFKRYRGPGCQTISEAMYAAGFGSYAQFHRVFRQAYGRGPRESLRPQNSS